MARALMAFTFNYPLRVRYVECDTQGVVFNANYMMYLDLAFTELLRDVAGSYAALLERRVDVMLVQSDLSFRSPGRADDEIEIKLAVHRLGNTSLTLHATMKRGDELLLEGHVTHVFVDPETLTKIPIPDDLREVLGAGS
jgi:acyl-CoA thioester hydrolase